MFRKQKSPCEGEGVVGGLKFKKLEKTFKSIPKKKLGILCSPVFLYFFIHPQPNNIGPARQPRDWGSL